ncbi:MAG: helix-turn-helix transcriptional regulator [Butyricicoccus sp.]
MESEHDLHIRAAAGEPAANLALCYDDRGCTHGIWQNDGGGVVSRGTCRSRSTVHCAHQCVSSNLAIFWKSVQDAFARAGFAFLREYDCPTDGASGGLLIDDLCHALTGEKSCYIFIDDFHLLTNKRAPRFLCALAGRLPPNVHLILASRDLFLPAAELVRLGGKVYQIGTAQLRLNHTELAVYTKRCGTALSDEQIDTLLYYSEGWFSAVYLNLRMFSEHVCCRTEFRIFHPSLRLR